MFRPVVVSFVLVAALGSSALAAQPVAQSVAQASPAPAVRVSRYSPEGVAILAQIRKLDQRIRFQQRMSSERRAREGAANNAFYSNWGSVYGYGSYGYGRGYGYGSYGYASYAPVLGYSSFNPGFYTYNTGPDYGTAKYRRLVRERAALQALLTNSAFPQP